MNAFQYASATSVDEAISLVGEKGRFLAGGIDLLGEMKEYIVEPEILVDVKRIKSGPESQSLRQIALLEDALPGTAKGEGIWLGGLVTIAEIAETPLPSAEAFKGLREAAGHVGSTQIRNVASLAGNILQHSRCWYYRQPDIVCLKKGGKECLAREGENRYHALFSGNTCVTTIVSNLAVMLAALDATAHVKRGGKLDKLSIKELFADAWKKPDANSSLKPQDFLTGVSVPLKRKRSAYRQQSEKAEFDWALVSCAAAGNVEGDKITDARVALGAVASVPYMSDEVNAFLEGKTLDDATVSKAADMLLKDAKPLQHNGYKVPLAHTLIRRTLLALNA